MILIPQTLVCAPGVLQPCICLPS